MINETQKQDGKKGECPYHCRYCVARKTPRSTVNETQNQTRYGELPADIQRQLQDHVNHFLSIKNAQIPGGIEFLRRSYSPADLPLKRFEFYGGTSEQSRTNPAIGRYIEKLNQIVDSANFALIEEVPADLGKIRALETELMRTSYGEKGWAEIERRNQIKEEVKGGNE